MLTLLLGLIAGAIFGANIVLVFNNSHQRYDIWVGAIFGSIAGSIIGALLASTLGVSSHRYEMEPVAMIKVIPFQLQDDSITVYQGIKVNDTYYRFYVNDPTGKYLKSLIFENYQTYLDKDMNDTRIVYYKSTRLKRQYKWWAFTLHKEYRIIYLSMKNGEPKLVPQSEAY